MRLFVNLFASSLLVHSTKLSSNAQTQRSESKRTLQEALARGLFQAR